MNICYILVILLCGNAGDVSFQEGIDFFAFSVNRQPLSRICWTELLDVLFKILLMIECLISAHVLINKYYHQKTNSLHMRKQSRRSAAQLISAFVFAL